MTDGRKWARPVPDVTYPEVPSVILRAKVGKGPWAVMGVGGFAELGVGVSWSGEPPP